jgi:Tfp pilus assembly PilM family ATPase
MNKNTTFLCQITDTHLKVVTCMTGKASKGKFIDIAIESLPASQEGGNRAGELLESILKKMGYNKHPVVVSLPRNQATCRYLQVPSHLPSEIENIVSFQASSYLPYPSSELITGFQAITVDKQGYSHVNLVIAHRDVIERTLKVFRSLQASRITIVLSSYGLSSFYAASRPIDRAPVMVVDSDVDQVEVAVIVKRKMLFSRAFRLPKSQPERENILMNEIKKTRDVYLKEISPEAPGKIIVLGNRGSSQALTEAIGRQSAPGVKTVSYVEVLDLSADLTRIAELADASLVSLLGLGLGIIDESLNLLPRALREGYRKHSERRELTRITVLAVGVVAISAAAIIRHLDNKATYLSQLKAMLGDVSRQAKPLEDIEKRFKALENQPDKRLSALDVLYELHRITPQLITLSSLTYEEDSQVILRGQTTEMDTVFAFVSQLEKLTLLKDYAIKINYATQKKIQAGQVIEFEIICQKQA